MPPPGSPPHFAAGQHHTEVTEPYYSNEDVAILHDIVVSAQELLPKLPERERLPTNALFGAYYDILSRVGVDIDHDNRYARVLFKIGGQRGPATLYEKFEAVLARMGIEIEFDHENQADGEEYSQLEESHLEIAGAAASEMFAQAEHKDAHRRQRRNSESSAWDLGIDLQSQPTTRRNSFSTVGKDHSRVVIEKEIFQRGPPAPVAAPADNANHPTSRKEDTNDNVGAWLHANSEKRYRGRGRSISTHGSLRVRRQSTSRGHEEYHYRAPTPSAPPSEYDVSNSQITAATSTFEKEIVPDWTQAVVHRPAPKPEDLLAIKATLFYQARLQSLVKRQLLNWSDRAQDLREDNYGLELIAINHDQKALTRTAFDSWRRAFLEKRRSEELKKFHAAREQHAWESRGTYLVQKLFSHWQGFANYQTRRTSFAKKHVIKNRVLNAWKDITVVNELKVERQVLKKFFAAWSQKRAASAAESRNAIQKYEENLVEKVYRQWAQKLMEVKALKWRAESTKRRALFQWIVVSHNNWESHRSAEVVRRQDLAWKTWKVLKAKVEDQGRRILVADAHYNRNLLRDCLVKWRTESKIVPAIALVQSKAATGTLRDAFRIWKERARQEQEAAAVDQMRILKEALTVWRYKYRSGIVVARIDRRVVAEALSSLRLREAEILFHRDHEQRRRRAALEHWKERMEEARERRWKQEDLARSLIARKTQKDAIHTWAFRTQSKTRLCTAAMEHYNPRLQQSSLTKWCAKAQQLQELDRRSQDANYYLVLTKAIKKWKASAEKSKREKRKAAFVQVRRMVKINLVRGVLQNWRDQARHTMSLNAQAAEVIGNKTVIVGMELFDRWRGRAEEVTELDGLWRENVLQKHFTIWKNRSNAVQALETEAILTYQEHRESRAVKQWSLLALKLKAQANYATNIREKNAKKNFRRIFSYWRQKALQNRPIKKVVFADSTQMDISAKAEAWTEIIEEDLEMDEWAKGLDETGAVSTPIPGYLSTPSKRSERVMAVAARFSTTPKAPLSTPFERQLRAQWSGGTPSNRKPLSRSTLGIVRGFADIPEISTSTNNDDDGS